MSPLQHLSFRQINIVWCGGSFLCACVDLKATQTQEEEKTINCRLFVDLDGGAGLKALIDESTAKLLLRERKQALMAPAILTVRGLTTCVMSALATSTSGIKSRTLVNP